MLFNSFFYILFFLPLVVSLYFLIAGHSHQYAKLFLVAASFFFYGWWNPIYIPLLCVSIGINYLAGGLLVHYSAAFFRKNILIAGIIFNFALLGYFKYANFFINNLNTALNTSFTLDKIILPLGISFFTFTQTAYLVDLYRHPNKRYGLIDYSLFVSYFPHLLAGPIIHHAAVMPQFANKWLARINYENVYLGLFLFILGLAKKVIFADTFATFANQGFADISALHCSTAWVTSVAYTLQLYFDFSGYSDMAVGASLLFNIQLPFNFNSPYQALNIQDFWRRWHITLSQFLRDYLYIPLGGNRSGNVKTYSNLLTTFILGGLWHGAGWTFIIWGALHGAALCIQRAFSRFNIILPRVIAWALTFAFVNVAWVFFRADSPQHAWQIISLMGQVYDTAHAPFAEIILLLFGMSIVVFMPNSQQIIKSEWAVRPALTPAVSLALLLSVFSMEMSHSHAFIYFQF